MAPNPIILQGLVTRLLAKTFRGEGWGGRPLAVCATTAFNEVVMGSQASAGRKYLQAQVPCFLGTTYERMLDFSFGGRTEDGHEMDL